MASKKTPPSTSDQGGPDQKGGPTTFVSEGSMKRRTLIDRRVESRRGDRASAAQIGENGAACLGPMRLIACIEEPNVARKILEHLGLRAEPLPTLRAQAPPVTLELFPAS